MKDIVKKPPAVVAEQQAEENNIISYSFSPEEVKDALRKTRKTRESVGMKYIRVLSRGIRYGDKNYWSEQLMNYYGGLVCVKICDENLEVCDPSGEQIEVFNI